jgi:hypothetical protein
LLVSERNHPTCYSMPGYLPELASSVEPDDLSDWEWQAANMHHKHGNRRHRISPPIISLLSSCKVRDYLDPASACTNSVEPIVICPRSLSQPTSGLLFYSCFPRAAHCWRKFFDCHCQMLNMGNNESNDTLLHCPHSQNLSVHAAGLHAESVPAPPHLM